MKAISSPNLENKLKMESQIPVMESFYTIQGEGYHSGKAAYFIRTAGCDVGCHWCDVKESWNIDENQQRSIDSVLSEVQKTKAATVVITGGEPLMHDLDLLTLSLKNLGIRTHIETSGAYQISGSWDWICLSPKKFVKPKKEIFRQAHELKVVVYNQSDFKWAEENAVLVAPGCKLYLQPEWSKRDKMLPLIIDYVKNNPKWQISLQTHKYMDIP